VLGLVGLVVVGVTFAHSAVSSRAAIASFEAWTAATPPAEFASDAFPPDQSLWSESARANYAKAADAEGVPLALLKIERLGLVAPVFAGTDAITLHRGVGAVEGTALPGEAGNVALSAHRDGFFRVLKDIAVGDAIELRTREGVQYFRVDAMRIVDPLEVSVLHPSEETILTLITCHPFYYVGHAPNRYVVRATLISADADPAPSLQTAPSAGR
jgi:sortase A